MPPKRIPLFPLDVVLFPGMSLPLHIFEPRYKAMIRRCLNETQEFGVVLSREKELASVGCTAEIIEITREYPDGRMDIMVQGKTVFRISEVFDSEPYHEAEVEFLSEKAPPVESDPSPELVNLYDQCHSLVFGRPSDPSECASAVSFAYYIAGDLPFELNDKQSILEIRDETERRSQLILHLKKLLPQLEQRFRIRAKARGNGHARA